MILTETEINELSDLIERSDFFDVVVPFARAIEAAILKKIGEPVALHHEAIRQLIAERDHYKEECIEQARLLGISGERELKLIAEREDGKWAAELKAENEQLSLYKSLADEYGLSVFADLAELQKQRDELLALLEIASVSLGSFTSDEGWSQADMDTMDSIDAAIANAKGATP